MNDGRFKVTEYNLHRRQDKLQFSFRQNPDVPDGVFVLKMEGADYNWQEYPNYDGNHLWSIEDARTLWNELIRDYGMVRKIEQ